MAKETPSNWLPALRGFVALPPGKTIGAIVGLAAMAALLIGALLWARQPDYRVLYTNMSDQDGGLIIAALTQMTVPYRFSDAGGAIMVPAGRVHEARLQLASQGLPKGSIVGFELLDAQKFGATQFQEQVNYQRALEGELVRSIQSVAAVRTARVHLAIPKPSVFLRDQQKPTASVLVNLNAGRSLNRSQVSGIMHLVSSSVADLSVDSVSVLDQNGNLLSGEAGSALGAELDPRQLAYLHDTETSHIKRILDILEPVVGRNNVRAQVAADLDFNQNESTAESYKPNANAGEATMRSQHIAEARNGVGGNPQGVPGALSNQPPGAATAPIDSTSQSNPVRSTDAANASLSKDSTINYEVDKTVRHTRQSVGSIKRLSAAVVVNYRNKVDKDGKNVVTPLVEKEIEQIRELVKQAIGFNESRGDSINVVNAAFTVDEVAELPELPIWKHPEIQRLAMELGKYAIVGALGLYLLFAVIRPFFRHLATTPRIEPQLGSLRNSPMGQLTSEPGDAAVVAINTLQSARELARQDPKLVASVVKNWVSQ